jgi:hypothetical protein
LAGIGAAASALALSSRVSPAAAQESNPAALASHPIVGAWLAIEPSPPGPSIFAADGTVNIAFAPNYVDPALGLLFQGAMLGMWEPSSERGIRFTAIQTLTDPEGTFVGTLTLEGHPMVSEDGQAFTDTSEARGIVRDATNTIVSDDIFTGSVSAVRITPGSLIFPEGSPTAGTPAG